MDGLWLSLLLQVDRSIEDAAIDLGAWLHQIFFLITRPNIFQAVVAAFLLSFMLLLEDMVIAEFLSGPGVNTLPQVIFCYARRGKPGSVDVRLRPFTGPDLRRSFVTRLIRALTADAYRMSQG